MACELTTDLIGKLGKMTCMDMHVVKLIMRDGSVIKNVAIREGRFIVGIAEMENGRLNIKPLELNVADIKDIKKMRFWPLFS